MINSVEQVPAGTANIRMATLSDSGGLHAAPDPRSEDPLAPLNTFEQARQLATLNEISRSLLSTLDKDEILRRLLESAAEVVEAEQGSLLLVDLETGELEFAIATGPDRQKVVGQRLPAGTGLAGQVVRTGCSLRIADVRQEPLWYAGIDAQIAFSTRSILAVPMLNRERVVGVIEMVNKIGDGTFRPSDENLVAALAAQAAIAIENARLYDESRRQAEEVSALLATTAVITTPQDLNTRLRRIVEEARKLADADDCTVYLIERHSGLLRPLVALGSYTEETLAFAIPLGEGISGYVAQSGVGEVVNDVTHDSRVRIIPGTPADPECMVCVPLKVEDGIIGVMTLSRMGTRRFRHHDLEIMTSFAQQAAIAIHNARLYETERRRRQAMEGLQKTGQAITRQLDLPILLETIAREAAQTFDAPAVAMFDIHERSDGGIIASYGLSPTYVAQQKVSSVRFRAALQSAGQPGPIVISEIEQRPFGRTDLIRSEGLRSVLAAPLVIDHQILAALAVYSRDHPRSFTQEDIQLAMFFASYASVAIGNARLYTDARRQAEELRGLYHIAMAATQSQNLPAMLQQILTRTLAATRRKGGVVYLFHPMEGLLQPVAQTELPAHLAWLAQPQIWNETEVGRWAANGDLVITSWQAPASDLSPGSAGDHTILSTRLQSKGHILGSMVVVDGPAANFTEADLRWLKTASQQIAVSVENAQLLLDLTQQKQSLEQAYCELQEHNRLKDELVQNVSHELRTPLTLIKGYVDLLVSGELGPIDKLQMASLQVVSNKTDSLVRLVTDIVSLQAISHDSLVLEKADLRNLATLALAAQDVVARNKEITLVSDWANQPLPVLVDTGRIMQVFDNLLNNAIKFSPKESTITIHLRKVDSAIRAEVEDRGIGIPADKLQRVFERFYQVDGTMTRRYGGAGLGLAICTQIIEAHQGRIGVSSELGQGATFWFELADASQSIAEGG